MIHEALEQALKCGFVYRNVSEATSLPKMVRSEIRVLTLQEMYMFIKAIEKEHQRMAFLLSLASGLRLGELLALTWDNVDLDSGILKVRRTLNRLKTFDENSPKKTKLILQETPKTSTSRRNVPIPQSIVEELKKHKEHQIDDGLDNPLNLVFISEVGTPLEPRNFTRMLHRIVKSYGIPRLNVHGLRHTFATRLLEENERPKVVQEMLGHATIGITLDTYSHVMPELKKSAAEKLNHFFNSPVPSRYKRRKTIGFSIEFLLQYYCSNPMIFRYFHKKRRAAISCDSRISLGCGGRIWTCDLRVMSPTSYRTAPPRDI